MISPDVVPEDITTEEAAAWFPEHLKHVAREMFEKVGEVRPLALLLCRRDPKTGLSYAKPRVVPMLIVDMSDDEAKSATAAAIRKAAQRGRAIRVGMMTEAWTLGMKKSATEAEFNDFIDDYKRNWAGRMDEHPDRIEIVNVSWQHRAIGTGMTYAEIIRTPGQRPHLAAWLDMPGGGLGAEGRFVEFMSAEDA